MGLPMDALERSIDWISAAAGVLGSGDACTGAWKAGQSCVVKSPCETVRVTTRDVRRQSVAACWQVSLGHDSHEHVPSSATTPVRKARADDLQLLPAQHAEISPRG